MKPHTINPKDPIVQTALVGVRYEDDVEAVYFVAPTGGGERLTVEGTDVLALTPQSPLGEAIVGRRVGDEIELVVRGRKRSAFITWIA
jgi:hypothetical protein